MSFRSLRQFVARLNRSYNRTARAMPEASHSLRSLEVELEALAALRGSEERALDLLRTRLSPQQRQQFDTEQAFRVRGSRTGREYLIKQGCVFNVFPLDADGKAVESICFEPDGDLAMGDHLLTQKIMLECDEDAVLAIANFKLLEEGELAEGYADGGPVWLDEDAIVWTAGFRRHPTVIQVNPRGPVAYT